MIKSDLVLASNYHVNPWYIWHLCKCDKICCSVQCLANYKVSPSVLLGIIVNTANIVFGQEWDLPEETSGESNVDNENDDEEIAEPIVGTSKRRMVARDLTYE